MKTPRSENLRSRYVMLKHAVCNSRGYALILALSVLAIITAMVVEFSYGVYISTHALHNWEISQRVSLVARSGVRLASVTISKNYHEYAYSYPGISEIVHKNPFKNLEGAVSLRIRIEDEYSKFNINSLVYPNGILNEEALKMFLRLLDTLNLDPEIAARVVDWIDPDQEPRLPDSEKGSKNQNLDSVNEILLIPGIDRATYEKLSPYITIFGSGLININGAELPVLMSLSDSIDKEMAERIIRFREISPFQKTDDIVKVAGFETIGQSLIDRLTVKGTAFRVVSTASEAEISRIIESVLEIQGGPPIVRYWQEF